MGYIMPVTHYDYKQYQNRMKGTDTSPHYVDSVYRAEFHPIDTTYDEEAFTPSPSMETDEGETGKTVGKERSYLITTRQKAQITGKGGAFNKIV